MAKQHAKPKRSARPASMHTVHPRAAGLDVGSTFHVVAVPPQLSGEAVRTFQSFTGDLHRLAEWLESLGITTIAMESTGIYWIPVFEILEARGLEVLLVNARDVKNVPGRKTDVNDAQWLQQLHQYGLLRGSFRPHERVIQLRAMLRHRERLIESGATQIQLMQKALMQMNVQLQHAVSDITGLTGLRIIRAIVGGEHNPAVLAEFRDGRCKASVETIRAALTGNYRAEHIFALRHALEIYDFLHEKMAECDAETASVLEALNTDRAAPAQPLPPVRHQRGKNEPRFDVRRELYTRPGDKFSRSDIIRSQREIINLGYFNPEALGINTPVNPQRGTVDIEYTVEEKPSDQLELSAGYQPKTYYTSKGSVIGTLGVTFNNFSLKNIGKKNIIEKAGG